MLAQARAGFLSSVAAAGLSPVTYVASSGSNSTSNASSYSHTLNSASSAGASHLYLCVVVQASSVTGMSVTCEGVTMTEVHEALNPSTQPYCFGLYACELPASDGGNGTYDFSVTITGGTPTRCAMAAFALAGVIDPYTLVDIINGMADNSNATIDVGAGGIAFGITMADTTAATSSSWTGATAEVYDNDSAEAQASAMYYINTGSALESNHTLKNQVAGVTGDTLWGRIFSIR